MFLCTSNRSAASANHCHHCDPGAALVAGSDKYLRIDDAMPFTTTPNHRIMVPKDGEDIVTDATKEAAKLDVGQWVICSDRVAKRVIGIRKYLAARMIKDCSCVFFSQSRPRSRTRFCDIFAMMF